MANNTWTLSPLLQRAKLIGCIWIFKYKYDVDGHQCHTTCSIAKGFHQQERSNYLETFNPVIKSHTIRVIHTLDLTYNYIIHQIYINNFFIYREQTMYMMQPPGFQTKLLCANFKRPYMILNKHLVIGLKS